MVPKGLATVDIGKMQFDNVSIEGSQCIVDRDGGVRVPAGIDDDRLAFVTMALDPTYQFTLIVALLAINGQSQILTMFDALSLDIGKRLGTID